MTPADARTWTEGGRRASWAVAGVAVAAVVMGAWGARLNADGARMLLNAPPFFGRWAWLDHPVRFVPAALVAMAILRWWPRLTETLQWGWLLVVSPLVSFAWAFSLTVSRGWDQLWLSLDNPENEYLPLARELGGVGEVREFVRTFVEQLPGYPEHVRGHGPLPVVGFWVIDRLGLGNAGVGVLVVFMGSTAAAATLIAFDRIAGRERGRRAALFVGLAPAVIWFSSADAVYMALASWSTAALAIAVTSGSSRVQVWAGVAAGTGAGLFLLCSYGAPPMLGPLAGVALWGWWKGPRRWVVPALLAAIAPIALFWLGGFNWVDGFAATRVEYAKSIARRRPYRYFVVSNLVVLAVSVGPATVAGIALLRRRAVWVLVGGAIGGALVATLSGYSKAEVERIWLPLTGFLTLAAAALPDGPIPRRAWLAAQLAVGGGLQLTLFAPW